MQSKLNVLSYTTTYLKYKIVILVICSCIIFVIVNGKTINSVNEISSTSEYRNKSYRNPQEKFEDIIKRINKSSKISKQVNSDNTEYVVCNRVTTRKVTKQVCNYEGMPQVHQDKTEFICPSIEDLRGCQCDAGERILDCSKVPNLVTVMEMFQNAYFPSKQFHSFIYELYREDIVPTDEILPGHIFKEVTFEMISLQNTVIKVIESEAFSGLEDTLKCLFITLNCDLHTFPFDQLKHFTKLTKLSINFAGLTHIPKLGYMPNLETVNLGVNNIKTVEEQAFYSLPSMQAIDLGENFIENLGCNTLYLDSEDTVIYLDHNLMHSFGHCVLNYDMLPLILDFDSNQLTTFPQSVFQPILEHMHLSNNDQSYLSVERNPMMCEEIAWAYTPTDYSEQFLWPEQCNKYK